MSVNSIINPATGKIYDDLIGQGGGIPLAKGQLITADAGGTETAFPQGAPPPNGSILSYDATAPLGLAYIAVPGATPLAQGQLLSADLAGAATIVAAPNLPAQANYVLTADGSLGAAGTNMLWKPTTGAGGIINANAPLVDDAGVGTNTISIDFTAAGQIPYGTGAKVGALTNAPAAGQILGIAAGVPTWIDAGGSGTITATAPLVEGPGVGASSQVSINFAAGAAGQIPYGNGTALTGALTNTPTAGQILGVSAGVPTWINAGGSGTITATLPLVEGAVGGASQVSINFTAGAAGQIPYGNGTALTGALTNTPTAGQILGVSGGVPAWVNPAGPIATTNFFELEFPAAPPFTNVGNVVSLPSPNTIGGFTKNELITIMNYETQGAPGGNSFQFSALEWGNFRGGISGLNTGGNENYFYYAYFDSTQIINLYRTPLPLSAASPVGEYLGGIAQASSGDPTCKVNGIIRTANFIYFFGFFANYIQSGVAPNTTPFSSLGNVIKYNITTGAFSPCGTASGVSGLYGGPNACINCACACPTTDKASGSYASRPKSVIFGGTFTQAQNSTLGSQYIAYYDEGSDAFSYPADNGATGITNPTQVQSADNEGLYGCSALMFNPDNNGMIVVCNFGTGVYAPDGAVSQPIRNGVFIYQNVVGPQIQSLGTNGQIVNSKNIEYAAGLVRKTLDNSIWLCLGYTDDTSTQNCWWYNLAGAGTGDPLVSPVGNPTPPLQVSSGGCDLPEPLLYAYGLLRDPNGFSAVSWFNPPLVAASYPDGGTYVWEDNSPTANTYVIVWVPGNQELQYTGLNNGAKTWTNSAYAQAAVSLNQSLLPAIVVISTGPYGEGGRVGTSREITDQFLGVLAFEGNGLQYIVETPAPAPAITKQVVFKTQYSSLQLAVDTTANIYRLVNQYGVIEFT